MDCVLGIDLGGTNLRWGMVTREGEVLEEGNLTHRRGDGVPESEELFSRLAGLTGQRRPRGVGLGAPGPLDRTRGVIDGAVNLPGWVEVPVVGMLERAFEVPVVLVNDATAFVLGEARRGVAVGEQNVLGLTLGTGVGGGALQDGRPLLGERGNAMEIGHLALDPAGPLCACGNRGCLEVYASASAVARRGRELLGTPSGEPLDPADVVRRAAGGDPRCRRVLDEAGRRLGEGIAQALRLIDTDLVVLGGGLSRAGDLLLDPARSTLENRLFPRRPGLRLLTSELGERAAVIGAATLAWDSIENTA